MLPKSRFCEPMAKNILYPYMYVVIYIGANSVLSIYQTSSYPCHASTNTIEIVDRCPRNEDEWQKRAIAKHCEDTVQSCTKKGNFNYQCLPNHYRNMTIEVCAPSRYILLGYCAEYSLQGHLVQENYKFSCKNFTEKPCPWKYLSTKAYKYSECFKPQTGEATEITTGVTMITTRVKTTTTSFDTREEWFASWLFWTGISILVVGFLAISICYFICKPGSNTERKNKIMSKFLSLLHRRPTANTSNKRSTPKAVNKDSVDKEEETFV